MGYSSVIWERKRLIKAEKIIVQEMKRLKRAQSNRNNFFKIARICLQSEKLTLKTPRWRFLTSGLNCVSIAVIELPAKNRREVLTMAHIHRIVPPRHRSWSSGLRAGRVRACTWRRFSRCERVCCKWGLVAGVGRDVGCTSKYCIMYTKS